MYNINSNDEKKNEKPALGRYSSFNRSGRRMTIQAEMMDKQLMSTISPLTIAANWAENCSYTGVPNAARSNSKLRLMIWVVLVLGGLGATIYHAYTMVQKYYNFDVSVNIDISYQPHLSFPAVTLCNVNPVRKSKLHLGGPDMMSIFPLSQGTSNNTADSSGRADTVLQFANQYATLNESVKIQMGHQLSDMMIDCLASGEACSAANFTTFTNTRYGNCYTFNEDTELMTHRPGSTNGISMELFIEQTEYIPDLTESAGMVLVLHDNDTSPFPDEVGMLISPATVTKVALRQIAISRLPDPYPQKCWNVQDHELPLLSLYKETMDFGYSIEACYKTCYQVNLMKQCSCGDAYFPLYGTALRGNQSSDAIDPCKNSTQLECEAIIKADYKAGLLGCNCSLPCQETRFDTNTSSAAWPNVMYANHYKTKLRGISPSLVTILDNPNMDVSQHILKVEIFYTELNMESISEGVLYGSASLMADIGGVIGLYIGMSVVAVFELGELLFDLAFYGFKNRNRTKKITSSSTA